MYSCISHKYLKVEDDGPEKSEGLLSMAVDNMFGHHPRGQAHVWLHPGKCHLDIVQLLK